MNVNQGSPQVSPQRLLGLVGGGFGVVAALFVLGAGWMDERWPDGSSVDEVVIAAALVMVVGSLVGGAAASGVGPAGRAAVLLALAAMAPTFVAVGALGLPGVDERLAERWVMSRAVLAAWAIPAACFVTAATLRLRRSRDVST